MYHGGQCLFEQHMELLRIQFQSWRYKSFALVLVMFSLQTSIVTVTVKKRRKKKTEEIREKDAGHNPKNNNLTSRSILSQLRFHSTCGNMGTDHWESITSFHALEY